MVKKINKDELLARLKEFYLLEKFQVQYYQAQLSAANDAYFQCAFTKMVQIESGHADYFAKKLIEAKVELPQARTSLLQLAGRLLGESVELTGAKQTCKLGIALESKAIEMYQKFILEAWDEQKLRNTLMEYLLDEEFHTLWMKDYLHR
ncbi:MAG TPA: demethoxyubiquinone hydroxylase family protein [Oscillospiraceae bacterium]|nr:demethoxyubiquinone hydroxylase family protein [Oscillospiraceae bacterium]